MRIFAYITKTTVDKYLKVLFEIAFQFTGIHIGAMAFHHFALLVHDEFGEVPFDEISQNATLLLLQIFPKGMGVFPIDVNFLEQVEFSLE